MKSSTLKGLAGSIVFLLGVVILNAVVPDWWTEQNVVPDTVDQTDLDVIQDNYKPALIGQAKHMAYQAYQAMEAKQPGSAGSTIENMVMNFSTDPADNYAPLLIGQLKTIAQPFYDRFSELGYDVGDITLNANGYPWDDATPIEENYKPANLGQLKYVFSFDLESFPPNVGIEGGLIAHWNFDKASGTIIEDTSDNQNIATIVGEVERASGYGLGQSLEFDALNQRIVTGAIDLGNSFTISGYFQTEHPSLDLQTLITNSQSGWQTDGFRVFLQTSTGQISIETGNGLTGDAAFSEVGLPLLEDDWNHLAIVINRTMGEARIYLNGRDVTIDSSILTDFNSSNELSIGGLVGGGLDLQGRLDELRIYDRALATVEINNFFLAKIRSKHVAENADLWLDANWGVETDEAGNVLTWRDQSGFGLDAIVPNTSTAPEWVERGHFENAAVRFDGIDDKLEIPGISGAIPEFTVVWYMKPQENINYNQEIRDVNGWDTFNFHADEQDNIHLGTDFDGRITAPVNPPDYYYIQGGAKVSVTEQGGSWNQGADYVEKEGRDCYLYANDTIPAGDFVIKARIRLAELNATAATFALSGNHFGFDGNGNRFFTEGSDWGAAQFHGDADNYITPGLPFDFEASRLGNQLTFKINGTPIVSRILHGNALTQVGFRPWRNTMRVYDFSRIIENENDSSDAPIGVFAEDHWHLMAFTFREGIGRFYKNGELLAEKSGMAMPSAWSGLAAKINGDLGELLFYSSELNSTDIDELLNYFNEKYRYNEDQDRDGLLDKWEIEQFGSLNESSGGNFDEFNITIDIPVHDGNL